VEGLTEQDARISGYAWDRGRALGLIVNKWDAVSGSGRNRRQWTQRADERYPSFRVVPKLFVSALTGSGVGGIWSLADNLAAAHRFRAPTPVLNKVLEDAVRRQQPPVVKGKRPRFYYATQTAICPPTVTVFTSAPRYVQSGYERYLGNQFRAAFELQGTPLRLRFRARRPERTKRR